MNIYICRPLTIASLTVSRALFRISREANPPLRLPLGPDGQWVILNKLSEIKRDVEKWDELTLSSVADDADPLYFKKIQTVIGEMS